MGYRRVQTKLILAVYLRLRIGESHRRIALELGVDKKTINQYAAGISALELPDGLSYDELLLRFSSLVPGNSKPKPAFASLAPHADEIRSLINGCKEEKRAPMKAKTAWMVVSSRYGLAGKTSYETFKRFVRDRNIVVPPSQAVARIETEPGGEVQIDYGKAGMRLIGNRRRGVFAYCGVLSSSRLPFIEFGPAQDEVSFARSTVAMFSFFGGVTARIDLDNLKAGVLEPDIHDPTLNRTFAELCAHYGVIADPARIASPKDKGKVERFVQVARELYRRLDALYPDAGLDELNAHALDWCRNEYGARKHGTTGIAPVTAFEEIEKPCLGPLPAEPFIPARWSTAKVHPDQFILVAGKYYGLPAMYIGCQVEVRSTVSLVTIYHEHRAVRQYPVSDRRREYLSGDFPAWAQPFTPGSYPSFLMRQAAAYGSQACTLIRDMLQGGGNLAIRRAQGCLTLIGKHRNDRGFSHVLGQAIAGRVHSPERLRILFEDEEVQNVIAFPHSVTGEAMARGADYYTGH